MFLCGENFERLALDVPDLVDVQDHLRLEVAHLGLVRLKQEYGRSGVVVVGLRLVTHGLCDDAGLLRIGGRCRMIDVVGILQRVCQHKARIELAVDIDQAVHMRIRQPQWIIAGIEELDLGPKCSRSPLGFVLAAGFHLLKRHARLLPGELGLSALAEGQANDLDAIAFFGVKRDRPTRPPDEIAGMRRNHQTCFCHFSSFDLVDPFFLVRRPSRRTP